MEEMKTTLKEIVVQRLSAAPDSPAKAELVEELTENLYCRYADLTASGVEPEEARARAVDALGDTDELVEYLKGLEPDQPLPELVLDPEKGDGGQIEEILHNVEDILRGAFHKAKTALKEAKDAVKEGFEAEAEGDACVEAEVVSHGDRDKEMADLEAAMAEKEQEMNRLEAAIEEKKVEIEAERGALSALETARDAMEAVSDKVVVEQALADIEEKIGAKENSIDRLEEELDEMETAYDALEEKLDCLDEAGDRTAKGWKVTYQNGGRNIEFTSEELKGSMKDMMKDIERVIRDATGVAKDACKQAKETAGKVYEDVTSACSPGEAVVPADPIDAAQLKAIDVQTFGGDITVRMSQEPDGDVLVGGDIEDIEVYRSGNGVLTIRPVKTETSGFFFGRGIFSGGSSADVVLDLPHRAWESLKLVSGNGDIQLSGDSPVDSVTIATVSGDVRGSLPTCAKVSCKTTNGDIRWTGDASDIRLESVSGDVEFRGSADRVSAKTTSGDLEIEGSICAATVKTVSGDVCLRSDVMPDKLDIGTTSGDMWVDIPDGGSFTARFRSTSGDFTSDFFTGRMGGRSCVFNYQGGGEREYSFGSISGDVELRKFQ